MKIVATIARILMGIVFLVFGLNKFYMFIPSGPLPTGAAGQFMGALMSTHYLMFIGFFEAAGGLMLLFNRYVPLGLTVLGPVIVNVLLIGFLMSPMALPSGILVTLCWFIVFWRVRSAFAGVFQPTGQH
ncbi:MAG TPA: hypothetical protein VG225_10160 [Terracidiphilus sp.]|jgi:uncharacterized membrane protein YphA (DoxX/SURF4 family)|nr:hypothetical protein [Terracidiphilus sp.]